jgi:Tfp pilus assembly protein PilF
VANPGDPGSPNIQYPTDPIAVLLNQALSLVQQNQIDVALVKVNAAIQAAPQNPDAYAIRGSIYAAKKQWDDAEKDFKTSIQINGNNVQIKFNLAEVLLVQKKYDAARVGFAALAQDPDVGDLASFKTYLCDLFGGHPDAAAKELDAFNQVGRKASYYFANATWALYQHKTDEARSWLASAGGIYAPEKFQLYVSTLVALGYLPLPAPGAK